jgi:NAD(P)-dependent dehydrogenase (short-subunit alcohol dehydrogenase family)
MSDLSGTTTIVVGASRGLGHGVASAIAEAGAEVIAVSRTEATFPGSVKQELADGRDAGVAADLIARHAPDTVVLVAGAVPHMAPLTEQTWETFSVTWETDVRIAFEWVGAILRAPLRPGSRVVVFSSGAALAGSPLSGGYAGAKSTQRFITAYAQGEAKRAGLDITFTTVLPRFAPTAAVGKAGVEAYAAQSGVSVEKFLSQQGPLLTPEIAGTAVVDLLGTPTAGLAPGYVLSGAGAQKLN